MTEDGSLGGIPHRRAMDNGTVSKISLLYDRYKFILPPLVALLLAIGFDFKTRAPAQPALDPGGDRHHPGPRAGAGPAIRQGS
jgi:hypothetical protein